MVLVQCVRCRNRHLASERISKPSSSIPGMSEQVCPRCSARAYFDLHPSEAWCWASGLIELGDVGAAPEGAITIARGERSSLRAVIEVLARRGQGESSGLLLVPGVPEADGQKAKADALAVWLAWCASHNGKKHRHGVRFAAEGGPL